MLNQQTFGIVSSSNILSMQHPFCYYEAYTGSLGQIWYLARILAEYDVKTKPALPHPIMTTYVFLLHAPQSVGWV